jgi:hypothetical protein
LELKCLKTLKKILNDLVDKFETTVQQDFELLKFLNSQLFGNNKLKSNINNNVNYDFDDDNNNNIIKNTNNINNNNNNNNTNSNNNTTNNINNNNNTNNNYSINNDDNNNNNTSNKNLFDQNNSCKFMDIDFKENIIFDSKEYWRMKNALNYRITRKNIVLLMLDKVDFLIDFLQKFNNEIIAIKILENNVFIFLFYYYCFTFASFFYCVSYSTIFYVLCFIFLNIQKFNIILFNKSVCEFFFNFFRFCILQKKIK